MELGLLDKVFKAAEEEGMVSDNLTNPFLGHRPLQNFVSAQRDSLTWSTVGLAKFVILGSLVLECTVERSF
jgi:hypothetical protein